MDVITIGKAERLVEAVEAFQRTGRPGRYRIFDGVCEQGHRLVEVYPAHGELVIRYRPGASLATSMARHPARGVRPGDPMPLRHRGERHRIEPLGHVPLRGPGRRLSAWCRCQDDVALDREGPVSLIDLRRVAEHVQSGTRRAVLFYVLIS